MVKRQKWSVYEDNILTNIMKNYPQKKNWEQIVKNLFTLKISKTIKQCKERWIHHLNPDLNKSKWILEENKKLFKLHHKFGNKWKIISEYFPGRTDNIVKNQFFSLVRKSLRISRKYLGKNSNTHLINKIKPKALSQFINHIITVDIPGDKNNGYKIIKRKILINEFLQKFAFYNFKDISHQLNKEDSIIITELLKLMMTINKNYERKKKMASFDIDNVKKNKKIRKLEKRNKIMINGITFDMKIKINFVDEFSKLLKEKNEFELRNKILMDCQKFNIENKKIILANFMDLKNNINIIIETLKLSTDKDFKDYFQYRNNLKKNSFVKKESIISQQNKDFFSQTKTQPKINKNIPYKKEKDFLNINISNKKESLQDTKKLNKDFFMNQKDDSLKNINKDFFLEHRKNDNKDSFKNINKDLNNNKNFFLEPKANISKSKSDSLNSFNSNYFNNSKLDNDNFIIPNEILKKKDKISKIDNILNNKILKKQMSNVGSGGFNILNFALKKNYMKKRTDEINFNRKNINFFCEAYKDSPVININLDKKKKNLLIKKKTPKLKFDLAKISVNSNPSISFQTPKSLKSYKLDSIPYLNK